MSTLKTDALGSVDFPQDILVDGVANLKRAVTSSASAPSYPANGNVWYNTGDDTFNIYANGDWFTVVSAKPPTPYGSRGVFGGGYNTALANNLSKAINYITIDTLGNSSSFGELSEKRFNMAGSSNGTRGCFCGGLTYVPSFQYVNIIEYVTIGTAGNTTDFGDLLTAVNQNTACSHLTRGVIAGGVDSSNGSGINTIQYITIATTGNATDFGDLTTAKKAMCAVSDATRGVFASGQYSNTTYVSMDYITIASAGNGTDFGDNTQTATHGSGTNNDVRGLFFHSINGSNVYQNIIDYITIATTGNATDFGDMTAARYQTCATSNGVRACAAGGRNIGTSPATTDIDYVTIMTPGNASDFGDLTGTYAYGMKGFSGS